MATRNTDEFRRDAVRIATTSGLRQRHGYTVKGQVADEVAFCRSFVDASFLGLPFNQQPRPAHLAYFTTRLGCRDFTRKSATANVMTSEIGSA